MAAESMPTSEVDVLIIGAGPAGMMMALWMARLGIKARIVDKRTGKVFSGQADGWVDTLPEASAQLLTNVKFPSEDARDPGQFRNW